MNTDAIIRHLENSGFCGACQSPPCPACPPIVSDGGFFFLEDPTCFLRSLESFVNIAWIAIAAFAGVLLFGWGVAMIRGAKGDIVANIRNLFLMLGIIAAARPIASLIWGDNMFGIGCDVIQVPVAEVNKIIDSAKLKLKDRDENQLYEEFDIYDSAASGETPGILGEIDTQAPNEPFEGDGIRSSGGGLGAASAFPSARTTRVEFIGSDGRKHIRTGGSSSWRHNNPGNIKCPPTAFGAIGCDKWLIFPSEEAGTLGHIAKLKSSRYQNAWHKECPDLPRGSLGAAICVWAPPSDNNNTRGYIQNVSRRTGIPATAQMSSLSDAQLRSIAIAQKEREGWKVGKEIIE
jgi:hypothetical protein